MQTYEPHISGERIAYAANRMVELANSTGKSVLANFNDITLIANPGDDPVAIVQQYSDGLRAAHPLFTD